MSMTAYQKEYVQRNREKIRAYQKAYREKHKEGLRIYNASYRKTYQRDKTKVMEYNKEYWKRKSEHLGDDYRRLQKEKMRAYYEANKEIIKARSKAWYEGHKDRVQEYTERNWERIRLRHLAYLKEYNKRYVNPHQDWRRSPEYAAWREAVLIRDSYKCQVCGKESPGLHAHHLKEGRSFPDLRYEPSNGITLCKGCHEKTHGRKLW